MTPKLAATLVTLEEVVSFERNAISPFAIKTGSRYVGLENVTSEGALIDVLPTVNGALASIKFTFNERHVLYGKLRPYLRKIARPNFDGICSTDIIPVMPGPELDRDYLYHFLRQDSTVRLATSKSEGINLPRISPRQLGKFLIPLPPLNEQRRIAAILDQADVLGAKRRQAMASGHALGQSIFNELFGDPFKNPRQFETLPLIDLVDPARPISYGILMPGPEQSDGVSYVRVVDMKNGGIDMVSVRKTSEAISYAFRRSLLQAGDLLISIRGHVGRLAVVPPELEGANITQDTARLAITGAEPLFVREHLRHSSTQRWMSRHIKGAAVRGINLGDLKRLPIILPPKRCQQDFARQIAMVEQINSAQQASLTKLDALFASLQHRAFRGEL